MKVEDRMIDAITRKEDRPLLTPDPDTIREWAEEVKKLRCEKDELKHNLEAVVTQTHNVYHDPTTRSWRQCKSKSCRTAQSALGPGSEVTPETGKSTS